MNLNLNLFYLKLKDLKERYPVCSFVLFFNSSCRSVESSVQWNSFEHRFDISKMLEIARRSFRDKLHGRDSVAQIQSEVSSPARLFSWDTNRCTGTVPFRGIHSPFANHSRCSIYAVTGMWVSVVILLDGSWEFPALKSAIVFCFHVSGLVPFEVAAESTTFLFTSQSPCEIAEFRR